MGRGILGEREKVQVVQVGTGGPGSDSSHGSEEHPRGDPWPSPSCLLLSSAEMEAP